MIQVIAKMVRGSNVGDLFMFHESNFKQHDQENDREFEIVTRGVLSDQTGKDEHGHCYRLLLGRNNVVYRVFLDFTVTVDVQPKTKQVYVCSACGSANVQRDAWVHVNDPEEVRTFDDLYCENCESSCKTNEVTVPVSFDIYSDIYKEGR